MAVDKGDLLPAVNFDKATIESNIYHATPDAVRLLIAAWIGQ